MKYIALSFFAVVLFSCKPEPIPLKLPKSPSEIVVSSQIIPNSSMIISLSRTFDALIPTDTGAGKDLLDHILVNHARVTVAYNGKVDTLSRIAPGFYGTFNTPLADQVLYKLQVYDSTTGKSVWAETRMHSKPKLDSAYLVNKLSGKDTQRTLHLHLTDKPGVTFYMINLYRNTDFFVNTIKNPSGIFNSKNSNQINIPLTDKLFSGINHREEIDLSGWIQKGDTLTVTMSAISQEYYTYLVQKQRAARNGLGAFFGEPVNYTTNVIKGRGFFSAHWPDFKTWVIKE